MRDPKRHRFFYAKLGRANTLAERCLNGDTPIGCMAVPIFFDLRADTRAQFEREGSAKEQGRNFFWCSDHPENAFIIVLHQAELHILRPVAEAQFFRCSKKFGYADAGDYVKFLPVEAMGKYPFSEIPLILSSMSANAYYYMGTFREITDYGNVLALQHLVGIDAMPVTTAQDIIRCLSSTELETLTAKIFEESGCFVPSYMGGVLKDVDIIARNTSENIIRVFDTEIAPRQGVSIQVKRSTGNTSQAGCDILISGERDAETVVTLAKASPRTKRWLSDSLHWLPNEARIMFDLE
ncbi:hypothetical protein ACW5W4_10445 [Aeromonas crassostreae]